MDSLTLLNHLDDVIQTAPDQYRSRCPSHEGRSRSLAIKQVDDRVLLHCFAGCSPGEVIEAAGLSMTDLFDKQADMTPAERKDRIHTTNAREILNSIIVPIRVLMMCVDIQQTRKLTLDEAGAFDVATATINRALDTAVNQGVIDV